jgi:hypothetical protein
VQVAADHVSMLVVRDLCRVAERIGAGDLAVHPIVCSLGDMPGGVDDFDQSSFPIAEERRRDQRSGAGRCEAIGARVVHRLRRLKQIPAFDTASIELVIFILGPSQ